MSGALEANGGQPDKPTKFKAIYTSRIFTGIWTNRSPLRDAASTRIEEKYYGPRGDAMIAGANVEVTNRLTLGRRPGNPIYDNTNTNSNVNSYDEFRVSKGLSDAFGSTLENIFLMTDTATALIAEDSAFVKQAGDTTSTVWTKSTGAGQSHMKQVGNQLYFGNGADNKKWSKSLFVRNSGNNSTLVNTSSYPYFSTGFVDNNGNIQQMIGTAVEHILGTPVTISTASITNNVLTLTVSASPLDPTQTLAGAQFMLWGFTNAANTFLNGMTITLSANWTATTITANVTHANMSQGGETAYVQFLAGGTPKTGASVPTWGATVPNLASKFNGSVTIDGNILWINRGVPTQNWGLAAPTGALTPSGSGSATGWAAHTYYSPASIYAGDGTGSGTTHGYLWQVTKAGITGSTEPTWPNPPATVQKKISITAVSITTNVVTCVTESQTLAVTDTVLVTDMDVATFLNGVTLNITARTATSFTAAFVHADYGTIGTPIIDLGTAIPKTGSLAATTQTDGGVIWTAIQTPASLTWAAHNHYHENDFLLNPVGSAKQFFQLRKNTQPFVAGAISGVYWNTDQSVQKGDFDKSSSAGSTPMPVAPTSLNWVRTGSGDFQFNTVNGAAELTGGQTSSTLGSQVTGGNADPGNKAFAVSCLIYIPAPGQYTFTCTHNDGAYFAFAATSQNGLGTAYKVLGTPINVFFSTTAVNGYASPVGNNNSAGNSGSSPPYVDSATWNFSAAGAYGFEVDYAKWRHSNGQMSMQCTSQQIATGANDISGTSQPAWPAFVPSGAGTTWDSVNNVIKYGATVQEAGKQYTWNNLGNVGDFGWVALTTYTLPGTQIVDTNSNQEGAYRTGSTGTTAPSWLTAINSIVSDPNPNLSWLNEGPVPNVAAAGGKITATSVQGWKYGIALVNTLDNTVSNIGAVSAGTGPIIGGQVTFAAGAGLNADLTTIDTQADYVAIFRTTDGFSTKLLINSLGNTFYTVPLTQYLQYGYVDTTPDTALNTLVQAAAAGENTPPLPGAINLTYHLNRLWYSIGNTVYYTTGPLAPVGNGINGTGSLNFDKQESRVMRLVPVSFGILVFTVSDINVIETTGGVIRPSLPYVPNVGIMSYNALDTNGPEIGFFTTDHQFLIFSPQAGLGVGSVPLADQYRLVNGLAGSNWNPSSVYVAHYANGDDMAWFVADGSQGWYKLISTPAPDGPGTCWSPFATIAGGVKAIKSVETTPGVHALLLGPTTSGKTRQRSVLATTDGGTTGANGTTYAAYAVFGSYVLATPGQVAQVAYITTDSVKTGSPLTIGLLMDEALPYYGGSFEILKNWVSDPPGLPESNSILGQRFYLSELPDSSAACRHLQLLVQWPPEAAANELNSFSIFGALVQEQ